MKLFRPHIRRKWRLRYADVTYTFQASGEEITHRRLIINGVMGFFDTETFRRHCTPPKITRSAKPRRPYHKKVSYRKGVI